MLPRYSLRTALLAILAIACTAALVSSNEHYFASIHANIENKLDVVNTRIFELTLQKRQHQCTSRICGVVFCGTTNGGPPAPMGECKRTERTQRELVALQAEIADLQGVRGETELERTAYRFRCCAVASPLIFAFFAMLLVSRNVLPRQRNRC